MAASDRFWDAIWLIEQRPLLAILVIFLLVLGLFGIAEAL
jgi:hypothetical protein